MQNGQKNRIEVLFGKTGMGKTRLSSVLTATDPRTVILDLEAQYCDGLIFLLFEDFLEFMSVPRDRFRSVCRFHSWDDVDRLFEWAYEHGDLTVVVDEVNKMSSPNWIRPTLAQLVDFGRPRNIRLIVTSRTPSQISRLLTSQAKLVVSFRQTEPTHLDYMRSLGFDPEKLKALPDHEHLTIDL